MTASAFETEPPRTLPAWLAPVGIGLLVVPFHPLWLDFEQVRRGVLLVLTGAALLLLRRLPAVRGERVCFGLLAVLAISTGVNWLGDLATADPNQLRAFQPWEAAYRLAHWLGLWVVLRLGLAVRERLAVPLAALLLGAAAFGVLQRVGLAEFAGYGAPREPVSVFGNLNVAAEWTAIAAIAVAVLPTARPWLRLAALVAAGAYLAANQSRSGLVALPVGLVLLTLLRRRAALPLLAAAGAGLVLGLLLDVAAPRPAPPDRAAETAAQKRATATLDVRFEIAKSASRLFAEAPLLGHGPGQFAIEYPRHRSQTEIEASSHGRQFASEVRTAHDDWIELLVDGGLPALLLFAAALFALQRGTKDMAALLPLFVLLLLMLVRSPLGNAPCVALALLLAGQSAPAAPPRRFARPLAMLCGVLLVGLGALPIVAHTAFVPYLAARARGEQPPVAAVRTAAAWMPFEPRWLQVLAQEQLFADDLAGARRTAAAALGLRPYDPQLYLLLGEVLARGGSFDRAEQLARHAIRFDPGHPELRLLLGTSLARQGRVDDAIAVLATEPHAVLKAQLPQVFADLAAVATRNDERATAAKLEVERHVLLVLERLGDPSPSALAAAGEHVKALLAAQRAAGTLQQDPRGYLVGALHALDLGQPDTVLALGTRAKQTGAKLLPWQRDLFGAQLQRLSAYEDWLTVLR
jgi:tetratricopeptide (TPR) repeat protein